MSSETPVSYIEESSCSSSDGTAISMSAVVFQNAVEEDAQLFHHSRSSKGKFNTVCYMISVSWMNDFLSSIFASYSASRLRKIENQCLLDDSANIYGNDDMIDEISETNSQLSFSSMEDIDVDENEMKRQARRDRWARKDLKAREKLSTLPLLPNLKHQLDFVIVGTQVWNLLSSEFGYDVDIRIKPKFVHDGDNSQKSLVVPIYDNQPESFVLIPENGQWEYDVSKVQMVSDDDEQQLDDLFPDSNSVSNSSYEPPGNNIIILPPSTTTRSTGDQLALVSLDENVMEKNGALQKESSDMEEQSEIAEKSQKRKRYGSGLGNLGNTCFMNSTLQCLAHTPPLRQYFISGEYLKHLNRQNPLGTGGELASEFAELLKQMWGTQQSSNSDNYGSSRNGFGSNYSTSYNSTSTAVYPRNFKYALGKHAEQFVGYDQHDSQELATYLLDALHEDTNRVTKKPYVEKPEQGENESDEEAAAKAWTLHLKREDSRILENCMGQIKSRVQCPKETCNRVSTTFDPSMYLSVPIPGATDRSMEILYISLDPKERIKKMHITLDKNSCISDLQQKIVDILNTSNKQNACQGKPEQIASDEIVLGDLWKNEVYQFYEPTFEIDRIRDSDITIAFQVSSLTSIQKEMQNQPDSDYDDEPEVPWLNSERRKNNRVTLDDNTLKSLNQGLKWESVLEKFMKQPMTLYTLTNTKRSNHEERILFLQKMKKLITKCYDCSDNFQNENNPGMDECDQREVSDSDFETAATDKDDDDPISLEEICEMNATFRNIKSLNDLAHFEFCYRKFHSFSRQVLKEKREKLKNGVVIQVVFKRSQRTSSPSYYLNNHNSVSVENSFCTPLILRIPRSLSVQGLRQILSARLSRALKCNDSSLISRAENGETCSEVSNATNLESTADMVDNVTDVKASEAYNVVQKIPLTYERKSTHTYSAKTHNSYRKLGSLFESTDVTLGSSNTTDMMSDKDSENDFVGELVGDQGRIHVHWPPDLIERYFDETEWDEIEDFSKTGPDEKDEDVNGKTSVLDCISSYCQMEQLDESEMWYCRNCKEHVRAWKQFHLYRTPPILIIHLKRFHFSATTHRRDKIDTYIDFPLEGLDLRNEVTHWKEGEEPIYDCYAVSNHYGGLGGGHYTAFAKNDGEWCHFDDSRITTGVSENDVKTSAAYVLYYIRKDVKIEYSNQVPVSEEVDDLSNTFQDQDDNSTDEMETQFYEEEKKVEKPLTAQ